MPSPKLLTHYHALESVDKSPFQKRARLLQSIWREEQGFKPADYQGKLRGARLEMPWAKETLANYLTDTIREVVRAEVLDPTRSAGKLYGQPRIFNNLLSSQPLCFNLFGELQRDLELATKVFGELSDGRVGRVVGIDFEYSPGRGDVRLTGDSSAFDVFVRFQTPDNKPGFIGIEVKYHENLRDTPAKLTARHEEIARNMNCFHADALERLKGRSLEQIWRDHLLAGAMLQNGGFDDGFFVFLAPEANTFCEEAVTAYRQCLHDDRTFNNWTLEDVVQALRNHTTAPWLTLFHDHYLDFSKIERIQNEAFSMP